MLDAGRLRELLLYDPETGIFTRIKRSGIGAHSLTNRPAGSINKKGYRDIKVDGKLYKAHQLAFLYMTGEWLNSLPDHRDLDRDNNKWNNLRPSNRSQNGANRPACVNNKVGLKGVIKVGKRYVTQIKKDGKVIYVGTYDDPIIANDAYRRAAEELHGEFARAK